MAFDPALHRRYFGQLAIYQIMIAIQWILIITSWKQFHGIAKNNVSKTMKRMFGFVIGTGTMIFMTIEWYGIADFLYVFAAWPLYCTTAAIIGALLLITYIFGLFMFYLYRLHKTFGKSSYALTKRTICVISIISTTLYVILMIFVFLFQRSEPIEVEFSWKAKPEEAKTIVVCKGEFSIGLNENLRVALQVIIIAGNIFYGWLFHYKLHQIIKGMQNYDEEDLKGNTAVKSSLISLYTLMKKQTILVTLSTFSTLILWSVTNILHFFGSFAQIFIYLDISINGLCLWMMFSWNHRYYKKYCVCGWIVGVTCFRLIKNDSMHRLSRMKKDTKSFELKKGNDMSRTASPSSKSPTSASSTSV